MSEIFEEGFIVLVFGGEDLRVEDLASLVDAEKDVQIFRMGAFIGILDMAGLCGRRYISGDSGLLRGVAGERPWDDASKV